MQCWRSDGLTAHNFYAQSYLKSHNNYYWHGKLYDGAETCQVIGIYLLNLLTTEMNLECNLALKSDIVDLKILVLTAAERNW